MLKGHRAAPIRLAAAPQRARLPLLPSGPDGVHRCCPRGTQSMRRHGLIVMDGGGGGIRTLEAGSAHQHAFQACALNRSATPPRLTHSWRRGWDSNPRDGDKPPTRFRVGLLRPTQTPLRVLFSFFGVSVERTLTTVAGTDLAIHLR